MAYALKAHITFGSPDGFNVTSSAIDTTGADFIVAAFSYYSIAGPTPVFTDSKSNTWNVLTAQTNAGDGVGVIVYAIAPTVGAGHTFTVGVPSGGDKAFASAAVAAFSGSKQSAPFDVQNGGKTAGATSLAANSITPGSNNELVVSAFCSMAAETNLAVDSGLTLLDETSFVSAQHYGCAFGYIIQTTAGAVNPTWSWTTSVGATAEVASFLSAAATLVVGFLPWGLGL